MALCFALFKHCVACLHSDTNFDTSKQGFRLDSHTCNYDRIHIMKKVWIYKWKNINSWWVGWYESGNRRAKALLTKELAEHYKQIKYTQLNSDVFTGIVAVDWQQMIEEYRESKKVQGVTEGTLYEIALSLSRI